MVGQDKPQEFENTFLSGDRDTYFKLSHQLAATIEDLHALVAHVGHVDITLKIGRRGTQHLTAPFSS